MGDQVTSGLGQGLGFGAGCMLAVSLFALAAFCLCCLLPAGFLVYWVGTSAPATPPEAPPFYSARDEPERAAGLRAGRVRNSTAPATSPSGNR